MSTPVAYYNEIDPFAAAWLRELIAAGHIMPGIVDERSIEDVRPDELRGFTQCHFFAGIGVWSYALRRAGWADDRPVWTGSCPCQPFSQAGKGAGFADERHLWPAFHWLIQQCRPAVVIGEQVASKATGPWFDLVQADLEALGYAFGCVAFPAASVGAPHIRDRAYWVANSGGKRRFGGRASQTCNGGDSPRFEPKRFCDAGGVGNSKHDGRGGSQGHPTEPRGDQQNLGVSDRGHSISQGQPPVGPTNGLWRDADWLGCRDGKWRPVESGTFPLANGSPARVGRLRGYGNAIVAPQAEAFIRALI